MYQALRKHLWTSYCREQAKISVKNASRYKKKDGSYSIIFSPDNTEESHVEKKTQELLKKMTLDWFPTSWLTFVCVGAPAEWQMYESFSCAGTANRLFDGKTSVDDTNQVEEDRHDTTGIADETIRRTLSKAGRRHMDTNQLLLEEQNDRSAKKGKPPLALNVAFTRNELPINAFEQKNLIHDRMMIAMEKEAKILQSLEGYNGSELMRDLLWAQYNQAHNYRLSLMVDNPPTVVGGTPLSFVSSNYTP
jgi:hypothetical protein